MVQYNIDQRKNLAHSLRKGGYSYSEIQKYVNVPKATLNSWFKNLKLTEAQEKRLSEKRSEAARRGTAERSKQVREVIEEIKKNSSKEIKEISKRELWLMGIMLYWKERFLRGNENDLKKGIQFSTSDPHLAKLFVNWLKALGLKEDEILFDIFYTSDKEEIVKFWSGVTSFPQSVFVRTYYQQPYKRKKKGHREGKKNELGLLRIRVRASSMLARQIAGWIEGIKDKIL